MKAIVAEIDKKQMVVITDKGDFMKVRRQMSVGIGDEIELKPQKIIQTYRRLATVAACFLMCIFLSTGVYAYYTPYSYVSVDINPSVALSLNRFERVISVNPLNEDAVELLKDAKGLKNQDIDDALSTIIQSAVEKGYIDTASENQVMVVVSAKNQKQEKELTGAVASTAAKELAKVNKNSEVMVEKTTVESYKEALANKVSPGKEILADKLREVMPEIKNEEVNNMSVKEVVHLINEGRKAVKAAEKDKDKEEDSKALEDQKNAEAAKLEKDNKGKNNPKPSAAASKENKNKDGKKDKEKPAVVNKGNDGKDEKGIKPAAVEDDKNDKGKDTNKEDDDKKKKENDETNIKPNDGAGNIGDNNGSNGQDKAGPDDKDKEKVDKDKEKKDDKKGD